MEIDARVLKEVEFSTSLRGYNTDEVDEFLEQVTVAVERLQAEAKAAAEKASQAERAPREDVPATDLDESIRKTLILAQRTADMAIKEAQDEAQQMLESAKAEAQTLVEDARDSASRITSEAERRLREEVDRLTASRNELQRGVENLVHVLGDERSRLVESLGTALRYVENSLSHSPSLDQYLRGPEPVAEGGGEPSFGAEAIVEDEQPAGGDSSPSQSVFEGREQEDDDLEAGIAEDAAAAAPSPLAAREPEEYDWDSVITPRPESSFSTARPTLTALPSRDSMQDTAAWQMRAPRADWPA
ncbi:MAG TPA: DivIVA domain-containing protein [Acidimicrobiales bacterium]|jgi:cell division initiation protein|nr:DivIVA domain-containing protein [Acidimicrobiales bacterium]